MEPIKTEVNKAKPNPEIVSAAGYCCLILHTAKKKKQFKPTNMCQLVNQTMSVADSAPPAHRHQASEKKNLLSHHMSWCHGAERKPRWSGPA